MANLFNTVTVKKPKSNSFRPRFESHLSTDFGRLNVDFLKEVYPGDVHIIPTELHVRTMPLISPVMTRVDVYQHFFFVPRRLLDKNFNGFITGGVSGTYPKDLPPPMIDPEGLMEVMNTYASATDEFEDYFCGLADQIGLPDVLLPSRQDFDVDVVRHLRSEDVLIDISPWAAYQKVFSDWYRDELLDSYEFDGDLLLPGNNWLADYPDDKQDAFGDVFRQRYRAWKKDYFTSARPDTQLGNPMTIPISGTIVGDGPMVMSPEGLPASNNVVLSEDNELATAVSVGTGTSAKLEYSSGLKITDSDSITINDLRRSIRIQEFLEKDIRAGNRYIESIFAHWGVRSSDARLQRSEYLGGFKQPVIISEVEQTSETTTTSPQGNLAGKGQAYGMGKTIRYRAEEHGWIIGIMSIMPTPAYQQGIPRHLLRKDAFDYAWPEFSNLGEQEVYNVELFCDSVTKPYNTFGYQSRYAECKTAQNEVHGVFRSSLNFWHTGRIFDKQPKLNTDFVYLQDPSSFNRIFASPTTPGHFLVDLFYDHKVIRKISKYGTPIL